MSRSEARGNRQEATGKRQEARADLLPDICCLFRVSLPAALLVVILLAPAGCVQQMANQPRVDPLQESRFFPDGIGARQQVPGTVARGQLVEDEVLATGKRGGELVETYPIEVNAELLADGRKAFGIFCDHCHGPAGYGDGMVVQRGFPQPPSYHIDRLRDVPHGHIFEVISNGLGRMPGFRKRIPPRERWAVVAYVRALQLSQHVPLDELPPVDREGVTENAEASATNTND